MTPATFATNYAQAQQGQPRRKHDCKPALRLIFIEDMGPREAALKTGLPFTAVNMAQLHMRKVIAQAQQKAAAAA